eukprot:1479641-Rhodomonas_salina.2
MSPKQYKYKPLTNSPLISSVPGMPQLTTCFSARMENITAYASRWGGSVFRARRSAYNFPLELPRFEN